ncbi:hypothetical protein [Clostridium perfringens]|nr:hypothetical protein [Clostridium perfringens]EDT79884.1 hypothetical protein AC7_2527 [Clostridium perfringens NCTC 8239]
MRNTIDNITKDLSNIELRDTLDCVVITLLGIQNQIEEKVLKLKEKDNE